MLFDSDGDKGKKLFYLTVHEIGHSYFPMIVGTDERRYAWMDEGLNTFIDIYESDAFQGGVYGPKRDAEFAPGDGPPADQIAALIADPKAPPIMTRADAMPFNYGHPVSYFKTAFGLMLLREDILGPERFDPAFRKFIRDWAYKHPQPSDFFRTMDSESGEDLALVLARLVLPQLGARSGDRRRQLRRRRSRQGRAHHGHNRGQLVLPATMRITFKDGTTQRLDPPGRDLDPVGQPHFHRGRPQADRARDHRSRPPASATRSLPRYLVRLLIVSGNG